MIIFVGDKPGNKNIDPELAFVGTKSYEKLLTWFAKMRLSTNDIVICNIKDLKRYHWGDVYIETKTLHDGGSYHLDFLPNQDKFVALGRNAEKALKQLDVESFYLPHPSGSNPKANKSKELDKTLKECEKWIKA